MGPKQLTPSFREKVWGATRLEPWFPNSSTKIGEVWFEGVQNLPLLVKFLFTSENLSVQVHPEGKTEMWHVLAAQPGSKIAAGFRESLTPERLKSAALSGTVHAIGAGMTLCEIQQYSDITYRLYDYGRGRDLHLDQALAVSLLGPHDARRNPSGEVLVSCKHFTTERIVLNSRRQYMPNGRFQLLIVIGGSGGINGKAMKAGQAWHVPVGSPPFDLEGNATLLRTSA